MKFIFKNLFAICSICILFSCKKDTLTETSLPKLENNTSTDDFINNNTSVATDTFSIDATKGGSVSTARGSKIIVPTNAFKSSTGNDVKGEVRIEIKEFVNKSDVVLSEFSSSQFINKYNDSIVEMPLVTDRFFAFKVISDSGIVNIDKFNPLLIEAQTSKPDLSMQPFNKVSFFLDYTSILSTIDTLEIETLKYKYWLRQLSQILDGTTKFSISSQFYFTKSPMSRLSVTTSNKDLETDLKMYFVLKDTKTVCRMYKTSGAYKYANVPQNFAGTIVAFAVKDGKLYSSFTDFNIQNDTQLNINLTESSSSEFLTKLKTLD